MLKSEGCSADCRNTEKEEREWLKWRIKWRMPVKRKALKKVRKEERRLLNGYKGRPLVRSGNVLYYGDMADKCVVMLQILSTKTVKDMTVADKVQVQLMSTDPDLRMKERILKKERENRPVQRDGHWLHLAGTGAGRAIRRRKRGLPRQDAHPAAAVLLQLLCLFSDPLPGRGEKFSDTPPPAHICPLPFIY